MRTGYRRHEIAVRGGSLTVGEWGPEDGPTVLAVHGITAHHRSWSLVAEAAPWLHIVAPDLRGRGRSSLLPGPYGMAAHAADLTEVVESLALGTVILAGHSMGGFVAVELARRHPELVSRLLLVDGGLPFVLPDGASVEEAVTATLGPARQRLSMEFPSPGAYRAFWREHPAIGPAWNAAVTDYVDYDLVGDPPHLRSCVSAAAVAVDSAELYAASYAAASAVWPRAATWLTVPRGLQDEPPGLYPQETVQRWLSVLPELRHVRLPGLNHYTILLDPTGAAAVADYCSALVADCRSRA